MGTHGDGKVIASSQLGDLADATERSTHDDGLVVVLLVVIEDGLDAGHSWVLLLGVLLLVGSLEPIQDAADEGGDEEGVGLGGGDGLGEGEHEGQVAVDVVLLLEDLGGLDTLPGRGDLDQNAVLGDANGLVELGWWLVHWIRRFTAGELGTDLDDVKGLVNGTLGGERVVGVDLGGNTSGDDREDLLSELDEEAVESSIDLGVDVRSAVLLAVSDGNIHKLGILRLLGGSEDQGRVGGGILRLVLADSCLDVSIERRGVWGGRVSSDCDVAAVEWGCLLG